MTAAITAEKLDAGIILSNLQTIITRSKCLIQELEAHTGRNGENITPGNADWINVNTETVTDCLSNVKRQLKPLTRTDEEQTKKIEIVFFGKHPDTDPRIIDATIPAKNN